MIFILQMENYELYQDVLSAQDRITHLSQQLALARSVNTGHVILMRLHNSSYTNEHTGHVILMWLHNSSYTNGHTGHVIT